MINCLNDLLNWLTNCAHVRRLLFRICHLTAYLSRWISYRFPPGILQCVPGWSCFAILQDFPWSSLARYRMVQYHWRHLTVSYLAAGWMASSEVHSAPNLPPPYKGVLFLAPVEDAICLSHQGGWQMLTLLQEDMSGHSFPTTRSRGSLNLGC